MVKLRTAGEADIPLDLCSSGDAPVCYGKQVIATWLQGGSANRVATSGPNE
jgi:hypothetical protein